MHGDNPEKADGPDPAALPSGDNVPIAGTELSSEGIANRSRPRDQKASNEPLVDGSSSTSLKAKLSENEIGSEVQESAPKQESEVATHTVFEFAKQFYQSKQPPGEQFKKSFGDLESKFSQDDSESLLELAKVEDKELNRTLALAEFLLETSVRGDYRDKLIHFLQMVASNVGSLSKTPRNDEFQRWLDECIASPSKLDYFVSRVDLVRTLEADKPLPKNLKNNLISIAAIWLFTREQVQVPELISVLRKEGMNLEGEVGRRVDARAFAFVASMIRSSQKKRFAYFIDWVDRTRSIIDSQLTAERAVSADRQKRIEALASRCAELEARLEETRGRHRIVEADLAAQVQEVEKLSLALKHREIHHGADRSFSQADHAATLEDILETVGRARKALEKEKLDITDNLLETVEDKLREELS